MTQLVSNTRRDKALLTRNVWVCLGVKLQERVLWQQVFTALFTKPPDGLPPYRTGSVGRSVRQFPIDIFPFFREWLVTKEPAALWIGMLHLKANSHVTFFAFFFDLWRNVNIITCYRRAHSWRLKNWSAKIKEKRKRRPFVWIHLKATNKKTESNLQPLLRYVGDIPARCAVVYIIVS